MKEVTLVIQKVGDKMRVEQSGSNMVEEWDISELFAGSLYFANILIYNDPDLKEAIVKAVRDLPISPIQGVVN